MSEVERGSTIISSLNSEALGICKNGNAEFVLPYVLPGEKVEYSKHIYRNKVSYSLEKLLIKSSSRALPPCKFFFKCGGCRLQHASKELYSSFKSNTLDSLKKFYAELADIKPVYILPEHSRRKVELKFSIKNRKVTLGFNAFNSHLIINIDSCLVASHLISSMIEPLKELLSNINVDTKGKITIQQVANGHTILVSVKSTDIPQKYFKNLAQFCEQNNIIQFYLNNETTNISKKIYQKIIPVVRFSDVEVEVNPWVFLQASLESDHFIASQLEIILNNCLPNSLNNIVELFCGVGTATIALSKFGNVEGYELNQYALNFLAHSVDSHNLNISLYDRDLFKKPLTSEDLKGKDLVVINPPRSGATEQILQIGKSGVKNIIYISCNPKSFYKDMLELNENGYKIVKLIPFDQFLYSHHMELIAHIQLQ